MTVAELISRLKDYHPETIVVIQRTDYGYNNISKLRTERVLPGSGREPEFVDFHSRQALSKSYLVVSLETL